MCRTPVITRYHPVLSVPASTIRGMAGDQETVTAAAAVAAGGDLVPRAVPGRWGRWRSPPNCSHNGLRVDEACAADVADLGTDSGHRVLRVLRKGARKAGIPLTPATVAALDAYLADRARRGGLSDARQLAGPLLATASGGRLRQGHLWELVRRLARDAGIQAWDQLSPHCLRHSAITFALDAGATLRDVQDYAGHKDPRTTRRYDHARDSLDRNAAYAVAAYLA